MKKFKNVILSGIILLSAVCTPISNASAYETTLYGDANCDGKINICDVAFLKRHIVGLANISQQGIKNCDFFSEGDVTVKSLGRLNKYIIHVIDNLSPVTEFTYDVNLFEQYYKCDGDYIVKSYDKLVSLSDSGNISSRLLFNFDEEFFNENILCLSGIHRTNYADTSSDGWTKVEIKDNVINADFNVITSCLSNEYYKEMDCYDTMALIIPKSCYNGEKYQSNTNEHGTGYVPFDCDYQKISFVNENEKEYYFKSYDELVSAENSGNLITADGKKLSSIFDAEFFEYHMALYITPTVTHAGTEKVEVKNISLFDNIVNIYKILPFDYSYAATPDMNYTSFAVGISHGDVDAEDLNFKTNIETVRQNNNGLTGDFNSYKLHNCNIDFSKYNMISSYADLVKADISVENSSGDIINLSEIYDVSFFYHHALCFDVHSFECSEPVFDLGYVTSDENEVVIYPNEYPYEPENTITNELIVLELDKDTYNGQNFRAEWNNPNIPEPSTTTTLESITIEPSTTTVIESTTTEPSTTTTLESITIEPSTTTVIESTTTEVSTTTNVPTETSETKHYTTTTEETYIPMQRLEMSISNGETTVYPEKMFKCGSFYNGGGLSCADGLPMFSNDYINHVQNPPVIKFSTELKIDTNADEIPENITVYKYDTLEKIINVNSFNDMIGLESGQYLVELRAHKTGEPSHIIYPSEEESAYFFVIIEL